jgi:nucleoside-diphosphate-sugar epimerase
MNFLNKLNNKSIGILGLGYIGSNLYDYLSSKKEELNINVIPITKENINIIESTTFNYFINCAGPGRNFREDILGTIDSNVCLLIYLLKNLKVKDNFIILSSTRIYGFSPNSKVIFDENYFQRSNHLLLDYIYNGSKKLIESIVTNYSEKLNYRTNIIRLSNVYGGFNKLDESTFIKKMFKFKLNNISPETNQNRNSKKDYIYISDAIEGILRTLLLSKKNDIFNIASGASYSLDEISKIIDIEIDYKNESREILFSNISIKKAKDLLSFNPSVNINEGLRRVLL